MKAYWITPGLGGTKVELRDAPMPEPKPGEILVRMRAAALNRGELLGGKAGAAAKPGGGECAGEVVKLGDGVSESDLLVHDEHNPALAYLIARLGPPDFPTPLGVFTAVERPCYDEAITAQVTAAKAKGPADLGALLNRGETWVVR